MLFVAALIAIGSPFTSAFEVVLSEPVFYTSEEETALRAPIAPIIVPERYEEEPVELFDADSPTSTLLYFTDLYGVNYALAHRIIQCESRWYADAVNPTSGASGYWQFLHSTWGRTMFRMKLSPDSDILDPVLNIQAGAWLLATDGVTHWLESKPCWHKLWS